MLWVTTVSGSIAPTQAISHAVIDSSLLSAAEQNTDQSNLVHQAYYRDSGGELRDTKDNIIGHCHTDASDTIDNCFSTRGDINIFGLWYGGSLVHCETPLTACKVFYDPRNTKQC